MIVTEGGHFWITFDNGYTLSCFNGFGSYTENHTAIKKWEKILTEKNLHENRWESKTIEIAILNKQGELVTKDIINSGDNVLTVGVNELVKIINIVNKLKGDKDEDME
jgi:hypothetical protein